MFRFIKNRNLIRSFFIYNKSILENFFSLSIIQALNGILPLIAIPYLLKIIHPEKYGLINISQAVIYYFQILVDYGFNMTATRQIAIHRDDLSKISSVFSAVLLIKLFIIVIGIFVLAVIIWLVPDFRDNSMLFYLTYLTVIGYAFLPTWFFQGIEKMKHLTVLNLIAKILFTLMIFIFVKKESDYLLVPVFTGLGFIISSGIGIFIACYSYKISIKRVSLKEIQYQLRDSFPVFISNFSISFYRSANPILLGFFTNAVTVGYYSVAEKLIKGLQAIVNSLAQALFPYMSRKLETYETISGKLKAILRPTRYISIGLILVSVFVFLTAPYWIRLFIHSQNREVTTCLRILSFVVTLGGVNYLLGFTGLINMNQRKSLMFYVVISGVIAIFSASLLSCYIGLVGAAYSMLLAEAVLLILILLKYRSLKTQEQ
ncbi:oligosaccharide flippase family protein [Chitinophaga japonensis]|uniref:PST family polysaccharide transporter n=1 Tax=Chitinophaga japonensis TaxID=104662 RepID=A0A562TG60_CHIJA|nr:oligosaccharide flippase family protein [Chitinophaga japonensis]TWI92056.1 PST family polysaccharide transporter [Chitinophaga japonensis]